MILSDGAPQPRWETISTPDGDFGVYITPPTYEHWVRARWQTSLADEILARLECITNWRDVFQPMPNGGKCDVPFSRELLAVMFRKFPATFDQVGAIIKPLFDGPGEDAEKNSVRPSTEPEATTA